ncbi:MAG: hypothetical protein QM498_02015 [Desulfobacterium sp.]
MDGGVSRAMVCFPGKKQDRQQINKIKQWGCLNAGVGGVRWNIMGILGSRIIVLFSVD